MFADYENFYEEGAGKSMRTTWFITGDTHGSLDRFYPSNFCPENQENSKIIILGDSGFNYHLNGRDDKLKKEASRFKFTFYCVRGNHEARPQSLPTMETFYDEDVQGEVYWEPQYPNIRYFQDGGLYHFCDKNVLTIGGAYSVDKHYRLLRGWQWFADEQLNSLEKESINDKVFDFLKNNSVDLVLTHTAPIKFEPTELFLNFIDQEEVDKNTEEWLQRIYDTLPQPFCWLFGHYHGDMILSENVFMLYEKIVDLALVEPLRPSVAIPDGFRVSRNFDYKGE